MPAGTQNEQETSHEYMFARDYRSSMRLNYNHTLMKDIAGHLLHPNIPKENPKLRVADIGTGTGIWALDLAREISPQARVDCFDLSADQFPAAGFNPVNVHFHSCDAFKPFSTEFQGVFDVVHIRFLLCIVNDPDARPLLQNILKLLKPGGYLQWFEPLPLTTGVLSVNPGAPQSGWDRIVKSWHKPKPDSEYGWVEGLSEIMNSEQMVDVQRFTYDIPRYLLPLWAQSQMAGLEDTLKKFDSLNQNAQALKQMILNLQDELAAGVVADTKFQCVIGRRATG